MMFIYTISRFYMAILSELLNELLFQIRRLILLILLLIQLISYTTADKIKVMKESESYNITVGRRSRTICCTQIEIFKTHFIYNKSSFICSEERYCIILVSCFEYLAKENMYIMIENATKIRNSLQIS
jgi:hypothetical protein